VVKINLNGIGFFKIMSLSLTRERIRELFEKNAQFQIFWN
jgi:hypothetical protein